MEAVTSTSQRVPEGKVLLISADHFEFFIDEEAAKVSTTLRGMLDSQGVAFLLRSMLRKTSWPFDLCMNSYTDNFMINTF